MLRAGLNCPLSSGMGRLFDGVAALLGVKTRCSYEGQGAVLLEAAATADDGVFPVVLDGGPLRFDWREMIRELAACREKGEETGRLAARFMNTLIEMAVRQCCAAREKSGLNTVALSGGSFQNQYLMARLPGRLEKAGFRVLRHRRVSCNDEGLSLGQLMIAQAAIPEEDSLRRGSLEGSLKETLQALPAPSEREPIRRIDWKCVLRYPCNWLK